MTSPHCFGRIEVRPAERSLRIDGVAAPLGARAFDLLLALIDSGGRLVTKHELLDSVWPGVVVEENNLPTQVSTLRKLLGPEAIATIPGRGYRFTLRPDPARDAAGPAAPGAQANGGVDPSAAGPLGTHPLPAVVLPARRPGGLPPAPAMLLGRDDDLALLADLLRPGRQVTLVGAGGIGKTTLALAAAHAVRSRFADGAVWVELAPIADAALIPSAIAQALQAPLSLSGAPAAGAVAGPDGAAASHAEAPTAALLAHLSPMQALLVLDNAEHQVAAVAALAEAIRAAAPGLGLLVTSQASLRIDGEQVFRLGALGMPAAGANARQALASGAVAMFVVQAQAADRSFRLDDANALTVAALCRRLDGLPLALKLAAARLPLLGLHGLARALGERLQWLSGGARHAPHRQHALRAALDWSHGLLTPPEQAVFRRLSVFAGGFSLELACEVAADAAAVAGDPALALDRWTVVDIVGSLLDRSLIDTVPADAGSAFPGVDDAAGADAASSIPRYRLPEIARDYASLRLAEAGEQPTLQRRHAQALAARMDALYEAYWCTADAPWVAASAPELDNLRAALEWSTAHEPALAVRLLGASGVLFLLLGLAAEGRTRWVGVQALAPSPDEPPALDGGAAAGPVVGSASLARFWLEGSRLHWGVSEASRRRLADRAIAAFRQLADARGIYLGLRCAAGSSETPPAEAHRMLGEMAALEPPAWPARLRAQRLQAAAEVAWSAGRMADVRDELERLLAVARAASLDAVLAFALAGLAEAHLALGHFGDAIDCAQALLGDEPAGAAVLAHAPGLRRGNHALQALATLGSARLACGETAAARRALADFAALSRRRGWEWFGLYSDSFTWLAVAEGRWRDAALLAGYADAAHRQRGRRSDAAAQARRTATQALHAALDGALLERLGAAGAALSEPEVVQLGLGLLTAPPSP